MGLGAILVGSAFFTGNAPAFAALQWFEDDPSSQEIYQICRKEFEAFICEGLALIADPVAEGITEISTSISYKPSLMVFKPELSGFLCDFSKNGDCPPSNPTVGIVSIEDTPEVNFIPGDPIENSTFSLVDDNINGLITFTYNLAEPLSVTESQNFFSFYFEFKTPQQISAFKYYDEQGNYDFNQVSFSCTSVINGSEGKCGSETPILGINIISESIPEPTSVITLIGVGVLGVASKKFKKKA